MSNFDPKPIKVIAPFFVAIGDRNWCEFCRLEKQFVSEYGVETWQNEFNFRIKPTLDRDSDRWLLIRWCGGKILESEVVG